MLHQIINLKKEPSQYGFMPTLKTYILDNLETNVPRPAVIVFPGGGYKYCSPSEGERIAVGYNAAGFHSFVLDYSVAPHRHPAPILDAAAAIKTVRQNAKEWNVNPNQIAILGFSAGGHLAASISTLWNNPQIFTEKEIEEGLHRPDASILSYSVITSGEFREPGSFVSLLGEDASDELMELLSLEKQVSEKTTPAFLWHTYEDNGVPVENTLLYAQALSKHKIPCEVHIYPHGAHGLSLVSDPTIWAAPKFRRKYDWLSQSVEWLIDLFKIRSFE